MTDYDVTTGGNTTGSAAFTRQFVIPGNQSSVSIPVAVIDDGSAEEEESLLVRIASVSSGIGIANRDLQVVIQDDDLPQAEVPEGALAFYPMERVQGAGNNQRYVFDSSSHAVGRGFIASAIEAVDISQPVIAINGNFGSKV